MWKRKNNVKNEILKYFLLFAILIIGILWICQFLFLRFFYREQKIKDTKVIATEMKKQKENIHFKEIINSLALEKSVCIEIDDSDFASLYVSSYFGKGCITNSQISYSYKYDFIKEKNKQESTYFIKLSNTQEETIILALKLSDNQYAFINTSLEPVDDMIFLIRKELIVITIVLLILAYLIAYYISYRISKPIKEINEQAKHLAKGSYQTSSLENSKILEIEELSKTLDYVNKEVSKTEELRRDLMANVSHDLKTPLTTIKATAEIAKDLHKEDPKKQEEDMNTIVSEVDRLTILVNDILELSKMESIVEELNWEEFDLIEEIDNILKKYNVLKETEKYHFIFEHQEEKIMVQADKKKLEQVIYNLINNAIHYTGEDNKIMIKVTKKKEVLVEISDTGSGIEEKDIPYIWNKYYKDNKKHKRNIIGTGLGLNIVKKILEQHHFSYGVHSKLGEGSTFYFKIKEKRRNK